MSTRILVVDDEPRYLRLLEANLLTEKFEVFTAVGWGRSTGIFCSQPGGFGTCWM